MQRINLYQEQFRRRRTYTDARHLGVGLVLVMVVLAAVTGALGWRTQAAEARAAALSAQRDAAQQRLAAVRSRLESARGEQDNRAELARLRAELAAKRRLMAYLERGPLASRQGFSGHLAGLARRRVEDLWLTRIELRAGGRSLRLAGHALGPERVPAFIAGLAQTSVFQGHAFRTLRIDRPQDADGRLDFVLASDRDEGDSS